jgi:hypothetical protein
MTARQYLPSLGRFTTRDVLQGDPADPPSLNQFAYVLASPVTLTDSTGLACDPSMAEACSTPDPTKTEGNAGYGTSQGAGEPDDPPELSAGPGCSPGPYCIDASWYAYVQASAFEWDTSHVEDQGVVVGLARALLLIDCDPRAGCAPVVPGAGAVRISARKAFLPAADGHSAKWMISFHYSVDSERLNPESNYEALWGSSSLLDRNQRQIPFRAEYHKSGFTDPDVRNAIWVPANEREPRFLVVRAFFNAVEPTRAPLSVTVVVPFPATPMPQPGVGHRRVSLLI